MKFLLAFEDEGAPIRVEISDGFICIYESSTHIYLTLEALANIGEAVAQYLESAAEESLFTEEDLEAGRQALAKWSRLVEELGG